MKKSTILTLIFGLACSIIGFSQDLIVTTDNDSINSKILIVGVDYIEYTTKQYGYHINRTIHISSVKNYYIDYYKKLMKLGLIEKDYPVFRVGISGGFSYQTANIDPDVHWGFEEYSRGLKPGYHFEGDISYFFSKVFGIGLKASLFKTSESIDVLVEYENGNTATGQLREAINIPFVGTSLMFRIFGHDNKNVFFISPNIGYLGYVDKVELIEDYKITGNTIGFGIDIGYDLRLIKKLAMVFQLSYLTGSLSEYELDDGTSKIEIQLSDEEKESLNRVDISVGLRFVI